MNILNALKALYHKITSKNASGSSIGAVVQELTDNWPDGNSLATTQSPGVVKQAAHVAAAVGDTPTKAEFDGLLTALQNAGNMAAS